MSTEVFSIDLYLPSNGLQEGLQAILHTILFYRVFGTVQPIEVTKPFINSLITYVKVDDKNLTQNINESVLNVEKKLKIKDTTFIQIKFSERKFKKAWFSTQEEVVVWETWCLKVTLNPNLHVRFDNLVEALDSIASTMRKFKAHVPPITSKDKFVFPYQIETLDNLSVDVGKSIQLQPHPILNLI